jgi:hypothetical protein
LDLENKQLKKDIEQAKK